MEIGGLQIPPVVIGGVLAAILLLLMLRFALRPKRKKVEPARGLGLDRIAPASTPEAATAGTAGIPSPRSADSSTEGYASGTHRAEASSPPLPGTSGLGVGSAGATAGAGSALSGSPGGSSSFFSGSSPAGDGRNPSACPKCGGSFLQGEMEGPTLMVDGIARDDFQPLLTARECRDCGYLELYTRPVKV